MAIARAAREPWLDVRATLPVPAGGMTVDRVDEMVSAYGADTMLLIGGGLLSAREKLFDKAREFVKKVAAARA
jgi:ribulose-bisphosphate carboxylase large chain